MTSPLHAALLLAHSLFALLAFSSKTTASATEFVLIAYVIRDLLCQSRALKLNLFTKIQFRAIKLLKSKCVVAILLCFAIADSTIGSCSILPVAQSSYLLAN